MKIAILYDGGSPDWDQRDVAAVMGNVREVRRVLKRRGHEISLVAVHFGDFRWLTQVRRADLVFNLCEGIQGHARFEDYVVAGLDLAMVPYTGCRSWPITMCHRKDVANTILSAHGLPVPAFRVAHGARVPRDVRLPAIVKPAAEDASVGIDGGAVCTTMTALRGRLARMTAQFEDVLIQEYVAGREFNVGFVGTNVLPVSEIRFDNLPAGTWPIVSYAAKWNTGSPEDLGTIPQCPAEVDLVLANRIIEIARRAWELLCGGEGYGRVDLRVTAKGEPFVLEVNPNPDLSSDAGLARMGQALGWSYDDLVMMVVEEALTRAGRMAVPDRLVANRATA